VLARGQAYYESSLVPWASFLTSPLMVDQDGTLYPNLGTPPGTKENPPQFYDPLKYLIQKAKQYGIEVHAWMNVYNLLTLPDTSYRLAISQPRHIAIDENNRWNTKLFAKNSQGEWLISGNGYKLIWLDPANPFVRNYLVSVVVELVKNYDIDAIHFDYIRFPGAYTYGDSFNYYFSNRSDTVNGNPYGLSRDDFARLSIERFVRAVYDTVKKLKPWVKVGTTTPGIYNDFKIFSKYINKIVHRYISRHLILLDCILKKFFYYLSVYHNSLFLWVYFDSLNLRSGLFIWLFIPYLS